MRRRSLLSAGVAAAASYALPASISPAAADDGAGANKRTWVGPPNRFEISVDDAAVFCDCFDLDTTPNPGPLGTAMLDKTEATLVSVGLRRGPVFWQTESWRQPDPLTLVLTLHGLDTPLTAEVTFISDATSGVMRRSTVLRHDGNGADIDITATTGFCFGIHEPIDAIIHMTGQWAQETQVHRVQLGDVPLRLESRAGKTGFRFQPYVAVAAGATTYLCQILWSGNWQLKILPANGGATLLGGLNNWRFHYRLSEGDSVTLPSVLFGRFKGSLNTATQRLHDYRRAHRPNPDRPILVQFNSWYPYMAEPTADAMLPIVPIAKRLGCEAFVVDAGWFRTDEGDTDVDWPERTGDWRVSRRRFPNGLREVSERCKEQGLQFGLWFEPEVIAPASSIRRQHKEWLHSIDGRPPPDDQRAILNLGIPDAWLHVFQRITRILSVLDVHWMKWDFNADLGAGGWAHGLPAALTGQDPLIAHYRGLYRMQDAIRSALPDLTLEMCASGGGRMDGEILSHAHVNWISDQPGPLRKLAVHFGTGLAHPAVVCNDWLVEWPPGPIAGYDDQTGGPDHRGDLPFRLRVAMLGSFGFSARVDRWTEADFQVAADHTAFYTAELRGIIHHGDQYHLTRSPPADGNGDWAAIWYVMKDGAKGVLFAFRLAGPAARKSFRLPGLQAGRRYQARAFPDAACDTTGDDLAAGLAVVIPRKFRSSLYLIEAALP